MYKCVYIYICIRGLYIYKPQSLLSQIFTFILCVCVCTHVCMRESVLHTRRKSKEEKITFFPG